MYKFIEIKFKTKNEFKKNQNNFFLILESTNKLFYLGIW